MKDTMKEIITIHDGTEYVSTRNNDGVIKVFKKNHHDRTLVATCNKNGKWTVSVPMGRKLQKLIENSWKK